MQLTSLDKVPYKKSSTRVRTVAHLPKEAVVALLLYVSTIPVYTGRRRNASLAVEDIINKSPDLQRHLTKARALIKTYPTLSVRELHEKINSD